MKKQVGYMIFRVYLGAMLGLLNSNLSLNI